MQHHLGGPPVSDLLEPQEPGIPLPRPGLFSRPYWDAAREKRLTYQRCRQCGQIPRLPSRTCVGCRATGSRQALLRVVVDPGANALVVDVARRMPGRGAWLHPDPHCLELAVRRRAFGRALRTAAPPDADAVARYVEAHAEPHAAGTVRGAADRR